MVRDPHEGQEKKDEKHNLDDLPPEPPIFERKDAEPYPAKDEDEQDEPDRPRF